MTKIAILRSTRCSLVNVGAKRSQDNKPHRVLVEACPDRFSRGCPLEPAIASQSPGDGIIPSSTVAFEAYPAPLIPARPFGLGWRFDEAPLVTPSRRIGASCQRYQAHPRNGARLAYAGQSCKQTSPGSKPLVETTQIGSMRSTRAGSAPSTFVTPPSTKADWSRG